MQGNKIELAIDLVYFIILHMKTNT